MNERVDKLYEIGETPQLGTVPKKMYAWTIRNERFGEPINAFQNEVVEVPTIRKGEVLIYNMVAGVNYNGVWAALGKPKNVISGHIKYDDKKVDFHICGSESSGIIYEVGEGVTDFKVGDQVIIAGTQFDADCPVVKAGEDPVLSPSFRVWGYESNWGAFAQFSRVMAAQCVKKPEYLNWVEAATFVAAGVPAYKMLTMWKENKINPGDVVLIWGGSGGIGSMAIQIVNYYGGIPVAVVSDEEKAEVCMKLGAKGCINRNKFKHWGALEHSYDDNTEQVTWVREALRFQNEIFKIVGEKRKPKIVFEHSGEKTLPTSLFVCAKGGMVVLCGGTTGYIGTMDLRYLWLEEKRLQGSHAGTVKEVKELVEILHKSNIKPMVSKVYSYNDLPIAHQVLYSNKNNVGKLAIRIGLIDE